MSLKERQKDKYNLQQIFLLYLPRPFRDLLPELCIDVEEDNQILSHLTVRKN